MDNIVTTGQSTTNSTNAINLSLFILNLIVIFCISFYRLCLEGPLLIIKRFLKHPLYVFIILVFSFPIYLFFQLLVCFLKLILKLFFSRHPYLFSAIKFLFFNHTNVATDSTEENDNINQYQEKCSICFDANLDLCLKYCRDQFCLDCFQRYISEVVKSSWGLNVTKIRCPVCSILIPQSEWTQFVSDSIVKTYFKFNSPYRSFSRYCPDCETEIIACDFPRNYEKSQSKTIASLLRIFFETYAPKESYMPAIEKQEHYIQLFEKMMWRNSTLIDIHYELIQLLLLLIPQSSLHNEDLDKIKLISQHILQLEVRPDTWRKLQFDYIAFFPFMNCPTCNISICLQCGNHAHPNMSCIDDMKQMIMQHSNREFVETLKWKIENSRSCPSCSIMIHRDDGCNKVDCTLCGFSFCWECHFSWAESGCRYFCCVNIKKKDSLESQYYNSSSSSSKTELGVPNVDKIYSKFKK